jgi:predicted transcriptional regulator
MGRPRIGKRLRVYVPDDVVDGLLEIAMHRGQTLPQVMRDGLADFVRRTLKTRRGAA